MFNTLLALNPNLKEVIDTISPFGFVFRFSNKIENLFNINLIKTSQNKGYKFYTKFSYTGNYIDVSDSFSSFDFCLVSPTRSELSDVEARFINYQGFDGKHILINAIWINGNSLEKKYNPVASKTLLTASCVAFVYGTLK